MEFWALCVCRVQFRGDENLIEFWLMHFGVWILSLNLNMVQSENHSLALCTILIWGVCSNFAALSGIRRMQTPVMKCDFDHKNNTHPKTIVLFQSYFFPSGEQPNNVYQLISRTTYCRLYSNMSQMLMLHKVWLYYNKFDSTKSFRVYHWYVQMPRCGCMEHGLYIAVYVQS